MLVLSRKVGEQIVINNCTTLQVLSIAGNRIRVGVTAPRDVHIVRGEIRERGENHGPCQSEAAGAGGNAII